jgi:hypothetical protein
MFETTGPALGAVHNGHDENGTRANSIHHDVRRACYDYLARPFDATDSPHRGKVSKFVDTFRNQ